MIVSKGEKKDVLTNQPTTLILASFLLTKTVHASFPLDIHHSHIQEELSWHALPLPAMHTRSGLCVWLQLFTDKHSLFISALLFIVCCRNKVVTCASLSTTFLSEEGQAVDSRFNISVLLIAH